MTNNNFTIRIAHLYGDLMNTYGDWGNIIALTYYAKQIGVEVSSKLISLQTNFNADDFDFVLFGGGQDYEETIVAKDLPGKSIEIKKFIESDGPMLAVCGGFQLLGHYMVMADGNKVNGISVMDHYTVNMHDTQSAILQNKRLTGNILIKNNETGEEYRGFENHQGRTFLGKGERPLGKTIEGNGNNGVDNSEGVIYKNVYGTYFHGPILTRNGNLAKQLLNKILTRKYPNENWQKKIDQIKAENF